jgi:acetyl esterase/lipase
MEKFNSATKDIRYCKEKNYHQQKHLLDVFASKEHNSDVLIFIHGGGWSGGSKDFYSAMGQNFANKQVTVVINNYRLSPEANFEQMALDCAYAVKWVEDNIHSFNGNPQRIFVSGHSAGGHLAALIALNNEFLNASSANLEAIKGCILIDAFGLNAKDFIEAHQSIYMKHIKDIFTSNPDNWRRGSPAEYLNLSDLPFLVMTGEKTHDVLMYDNQIFVQKLTAKGKTYTAEIYPNKTHMQMITQMSNTNNELYSKIIAFMKSN